MRAQGTAQGGQDSLTTAILSCPGPACTAPAPPFSTTPKFLSPLLSLQCTCAFCAFHLSQGGGRGTGAWHPQEWGLWPYFCHILWDEVLIHEMGIIIPPPSWACFLSSDPLFSQHHGFPSPGVGRLWPMVCL